MQNNNSILLAESKWNQSILRPLQCKGRGQRTNLYQTITSQECIIFRIFAETTVKECTSTKLTKGTRMSEKIQKQVIGEKRFIEQAGKVEYQQYDVIYIKPNV